MFFWHSRVCVQCCLPRDTLFKMDVLFWLPVASRDDFTAEKIAMHVQSISHWAPANIGPYSQAVRVRKAWIIGDTPELLKRPMSFLE